MTHAVVGEILAAPLVPGSLFRDERELGSRLNTTPSSRFPVNLGDESSVAVRVRIAAVVCSRSIAARSSDVVARKAGAPSLKRWQKHSWSQHRALPTTA
jgi:hypothetical protein